MTISDMTDPGTLNGAPVQCSDGEKLGKVDSVYYDNDTNKPEWAAVKSGIFGGHVSLVPLKQGNWDDNTLTYGWAPRPSRRTSGSTRPSARSALTPRAPKAPKAPRGRRRERPRRRRGREPPRR